MLIYTARRLVSTVFVLLMASFITFVFAATTYDPLKPYREQNPQPSRAFFHAKEVQYHLDQPVLERYWNWLTRLIHIDVHSAMFIRFNFGDDVNGAPVSTALAQRLEVTSRLIIGALVVAALLAILGGVVSGVRAGKPVDIVVTLLTFLLLALPTFWFAALLKGQAIQANNALGTGFYTAFDQTPGLSASASGWPLFKDQLAHLVLPVASLGLLTAAHWIRYQRAATIDVLEADFMRLAHAKGLRRSTVIRRHGLRNALIPLVTVAAIDAGALFGGAIITESVYVWHGMGDYIKTAVDTEDTNAVAGWVMVSALFVVLFNLLADLLYAALDPRTRLA